MSFPLGKKTYRIMSYLYVNMRSYKGKNFSGWVVVMYLHVVGLVFSRCGGWYPMSHVVWGDAGISHIIGDQVLFCTDVVARL